MIISDGSARIGIDAAVHVRKQLDLGYLPTHVQCRVGLCIGLWIVDLAFAPVEVIVDDIEPAILAKTEVSHSAASSEAPESMTTRRMRTIPSCRLPSLHLANQLALPRSKKGIVVVVVVDVINVVKPAKPVLCRRC